MGKTTPQADKSASSPNREQISPLIGGDPALAGEGVAQPIKILNYSFLIFTYSHTLLSVFLQ